MVRTLCEHIEGLYDAIRREDRFKAEFSALGLAVPRIRWRDASMLRRILTISREVFREGQKTRGFDV